MGARRTSPMQGGRPLARSFVMTSGAVAVDPFKGAGASKATRKAPTSRPPGPVKKSFPGLRNFEGSGPR